jgi:hypothetical protein
LDRGVGDIGIVEILWPSHVPPDSTITPGAVIRNYSGEEAYYGAYFFIINKYGARVYNASLPDLTIDGWDTDILHFPDFNPGNDTGRWHLRCSLATGDTNFSNDTLTLWFNIGVEEGQPQAASFKPQATVLRALPKCTVAFDATGRRVLNPKPGILFVQERIAVGSEQSALRVRKVVLQR